MFWFEVAFPYAGTAQSVQRQRRRHDGREQIPVRDWDFLFRRVRTGSGTHQASHLLGDEGSSPGDRAAEA
jgi:hypothetical protein